MEYEEPGYWEMLIRRSVSRFLFLACLAKGPQHGYEIGKTMRALYGGCCDPSEAMIYPTLRQLQEGGYVDCHAEHVGGREQKVCQLTERGYEAFRAAAASWGQVLPYLQTAIDEAGEAATIKPRPGTVVNIRR